MNRQQITVLQTSNIWKHCLEIRGKKLLNAFTALFSHMFKAISLFFAIVCIMMIAVPAMDTINTVQAQMVAGNTTSTANTTTTANTSTTKGKPLGLTITLLGLNKTSGNIISFGTITNGTKNATKAVVYDAKELDLTDNISDGIGKTYLYFPNTFMHAGDQITGCYIVLKTLNTHCNTILKSPDSKRTEEEITLLINPTR
jgi:hypothetical protein